MKTINFHDYSVLSCHKICLASIKSAPILSIPHDHLVSNNINFAEEKKKVLQFF